MAHRNNNSNYPYLIKTIPQQPCGLKTCPSPWADDVVLQWLFLLGDKTLYLSYLMYACGSGLVCRSSRSRLLAEEEDNVVDVGPRHLLN